MSHRLAIVTSHPVQYQVPWFRVLAAEPDVELEVLFGHYASAREQADAGFGVEFDWDTPLLHGYPHRFLRNVATAPSVNTFAGVNTPGVSAVLREGKFDAVLVHGWHTRGYLQAIRACWREGIPVMVRGDSHLHDARPLALRLAKELPYRYLIHGMDACLPVGTWSRDYFLHYGAKPERTFLSPHSSPVLTAPQACQQLREDSRRAWGVPDNAVVFLLAGKLIPRKCPADFLRALARAHETTPVFGLIAGDGPLAEESQRLAMELAVPAHFTGFLNQTEMGRAYAAADVLVLASSQETWGLVANEAMGWGLPCIVSDLVGCGPDLVEDGITGFVFPLHDISALAGLMVRCAASPGLLSQMSRAAHNRITAFSPAATAAGVLSALAAIREAR